MNLAQPSTGISLKQVNNSVHIFRQLIEYWKTCLPIVCDFDIAGPSYRVDSVRFWIKKLRLLKVPVPIFPLTPVSSIRSIMGISS
jgi:hypothetical protein